MCVWAHRLMGEGRASALTQYPTHTHRELGRKERFALVSLLSLGRKEPQQGLSAGGKMGLFWTGEGLRYMLPMVTD